jgi:Flp pilus assembly protein TadB
MYSTLGGRTTGRSRAVRSSRFRSVGVALAAGCLAAVLAYLVLPSALSSAWRGVVSVALGWLVVFLLAWRLRLGHADLWWWPFAVPRADRHDKE